MMFDRHICLSQLFTLLLISYSHTAISKSQQLKIETSFDRGQTWQQHIQPHSSPPVLSLLRLSNTKSSPVIELPSCALSASLTIRVWRSDKNSEDENEPFGLSWESNACNEYHPEMATERTQIKSYKIYRDVPEWSKYVQPQSIEDNNQIDTENEQKYLQTNKNKNWFRKAAPYLMVFLGIALAHGIKLGLAELKREAELNENNGPVLRARSQVERELQTQQQNQPIRVTAPRNRSTLRSRKKSSKSGAR